MNFQYNETVLINFTIYKYKYKDTTITLILISIFFVVNFQK